MLSLLMIFIVYWCLIGQGIGISGIHLSNTNWLNVFCVCDWIPLSTKLIDHPLNSAVMVVLSTGSHCNEEEGIWVQRLSQLECCGLCNWQVLLCANGRSVHIECVYRCYCEWYDGGLGYCLRCGDTSEGMKHTDAWWGILVSPELSLRREKPAVCGSLDMSQLHNCMWWSLGSLPSSLGYGSPPPPHTHTLISLGHKANVEALT